MPTSQESGLLKKSANVDIQLLQAWTDVRTIISNTKPKTITTYKEYLGYLVSHSEILEESSVDNSGQRANVAETNIMDSYVPEDNHYDNTTELAAYIGELDVDMVQSTIECYHALQDGKPRPHPRVRREQQPSRPDLQMKELLW